MSDLILTDGWSGVLLVFFSPLAEEMKFEEADVRIEGERANFIGTAGWVGDFNEDGIADLIVSAPAEPEESCAIGPEGAMIFLGPFTKRSVLHSEDAETTILDGATCDGWFMEVFDMDNDGRLDLLMGNRRGEIHGFLGPLTSGRLTRSDANLRGEQMRGFVKISTRLQTENHLDLLVGRNDGGESGIAWLEGPFIGSAIDETHIKHRWKFAPDFFVGLGEPMLIAEDFNGDGLTDLILTKRSAGPLFMQLGKLDTRHSSFPGLGLSYDPGFGDVGGNYKRYTVGDVVGDHRPEVVIAIGNTLFIIAFDLIE